MKTTLKNCYILPLLLLIIGSNVLSGQNIGISDDGSTPDASAMLDVKSTDKGLLIPRAETTAIMSPATGLMVFQPSDNKFYYYNGTTWISFNGKLYDGDNDTGIDVERVTDEDKIRFDVGGKEALKIEYNDGGILRFNTPGFSNKQNLFMGFNAGDKTGLDSTFVNSGKFNTGIGYEVLRSNTNGLTNTAMGAFSMYDNTTGSSNTAYGYNTLSNNISGFGNTAIGIDALESNTTGQYNVGIGLNAMTSNKGSSYSVGVGSRAAVFDTSALRSVYVGSNAGAGGSVSSDQHSKSNNVMIGYNAGEDAQGSNNIFLGYEAGQNEDDDNKLYIENSNADSTGALIYGDFQDDVLMLNGKVMVRDGITDTDMDTKIHLEESLDEDKIRFDVRGKEALKMEYSDGDIMVFNTPGVSNKQNLFIGYEAGSRTGLDSTFVNSSRYNTGIGFEALRFNTNGLINTAVGSSTLRLNTSGNGNAAFGYCALQANISGSNNAAIGNGALKANSSGSNNVAMGLNALLNNLSSGNSVGIGSRTAVFDQGTLNSVYIGSNAGAGGQTTSDLHTKSNNVMIGYNAGEDAQGSNNIFLGYEAGQNETGSSKLYIENSNAGPSDALIYGDFATNLLRVNGSLNINEEYTFPAADGGAGRVLSTNGSGTLSWQLDDDGPWNVNGSNEPYYTAAFVGVGTTNPSTRFHAVHAVDGDYVARFDNQDQNAKAHGLEIEIGPNSNPEPTNIFIAFNDGNGTQVGSITGDASGGVIYNTTSDRRLKQNISTFNQGVDLVKKIEAYSYEMKSNPGTKHIGFIAQELYKVLPQIVKGSPTESSLENPMMVDYSKMTPILLAAVKELIEENDVLKHKVENLENSNAQISDLKAQLDAQLSMINKLSQSIGTKVD